MKRITFLTAAAAVAMMTLAVSCGQNAQNQTSVAQTEEVQQEVEQTMDEAQLKALMETIYYKLPTSVMPSYLRTENQRRDADVFETFQENRILEMIDGDGGYDKWEMFVYLTEDQNNIVVIVQFGAGLDGYLVQSDKTLNYNIKTGELTEIERPMDPITIDELFEPSLYDSPAQAAKAKKYLTENANPYCCEFDKDGFKIDDGIDYWEWNEIYGVENKVIPTRKWNGNRFVKSTRLHWGEHDWVPLNE